MALRPSIAGRSVTRLTRSGEAAHRCSRAQHHRLSRICSLWSQQASLRPGRRYLGRHPGRGRAVHILGRHAAQVLTPASCVSPSSPRADNSQPTAPGWLALSAACGSSLSRHIRTVGTPSYWVGHRFECDWLLSGVLPCQRPVASVIWVALLYKGRAQRAYVARA